MTRPFKPTKKKESEYFEQTYCDNCALDVSNSKQPCQIWIKFLYDGIREHPEWVYDENNLPCCTSFQDKNAETITVEVTSGLQGRI